MTLDRTGEPIDPDTNPGPDCICDGSKPGFADYNGDRPKPCPRHKPKLAEAVRRRNLYSGSDPGPTRPTPTPVQVNDPNQGDTDGR